MRRILAGALLALVLAGCSSSSDGPRLDLQPSSTTTTSPAGAALAARLPTTALDGFVRADAAFGGGPLDLDGAASSSNDSAAERKRLTDAGFVRGVTRSWVNGASADTAYVAVYEFGDAAGAARYAAAQATVLEGAGAIPFADGGGYTTVEQDGETTLTTHAAIRQVGTRWALVLLASQVADRTPAEAKQIAAAIQL
ncbi:MAG: hypothetical protein JWN67_3864 [Actinomycetia bacterium]|nr:hypothetical protein [Actinomycetes bacterium]